VPRSQTCPPCKRIIVAGLHTPFKSAGRLLNILSRPMDACRQAIVKPKFRQALVDLIKEASADSADSGCPKAQGALLYTTASKVGRLEGNRGRQGQGRRKAERHSGVRARGVQRPPTTASGTERCCRQRGLATSPLSPASLLRCCSTPPTRWPIAASFWP
jgi:hypothetical protein